MSSSGTGEEKREVKTLEEICILITDGSHYSPASVKQGYFMASVKDMTKYGFDFSNCRRISEEDYNILVKNGCKPMIGDILIGKDGARYLDDVFVFRQNVEVVVLSSIAILRVDRSSVLPEYLYYFLADTNIKTQIKNNYGSGSAIPRMVLRDFKRVPISFPQLNRQKGIVDTLSCLDDMIELNNRTNQLLEEIAQAIFKRWFVDFEFPNEDGEPYKSSGGEMVDSELGEIPKGWRVKKAGDIFNISIGKTPPRKEAQWFTENNIDMKWVSISDMGASGVYIMNSSEYLTKEAIDNFNIKMVPENTVLLSFKLTVGRVAITNELMATNEAIAHFVTDDHKTTEYLYLYLKQFNFETMGNTSSIATAINSKVVRTIPIITMDINTLERFYSIMKPIFKKIRINQKESATLVSIRDTLLPKLMSGEIRVPIEEVV